jgi:hypothetical protein
MNTWNITTTTGQHIIAGRGVLITFIPVENDIRFENAYPFLPGDLMLYNGRVYPIIGIERFPKSFNNDHEPFGFLIKSL